MPTAQDFQYAGMGAIKSAVLATFTTSTGPICRGVMCNVAGTVTGQLEGDSADGDYILLAGSVYPLCFKSISSVGTATGRLLF